MIVAEHIFMCLCLLRHVTTQQTVYVMKFWSIVDAQFYLSKGKNQKTFFDFLLVTLLTF